MGANAHLKIESFTGDEAFQPERNNKEEKSDTSADAGFFIDTGLSTAAVVAVSDAGTVIYRRFLSSLSICVIYRCRHRYRRRHRHRPPRKPSPLLAPYAPPGPSLPPEPLTLPARPRGYRHMRGRKASQIEALLHRE